MTDQERFADIESRVGRGDLHASEIDWAVEYWINNDFFECFLTKVYEKKQPWYVRLWNFIAA